MIELRGSAWNHTRGFLPVVATAQRWEERNPEIRITWEKRSLQAQKPAATRRMAAAGLSRRPASPLDRPVFRELLL